MLSDYRSDVNMCIYYAFDEKKNRVSLEVRSLQHRYLETLTCWCTMSHQKEGSSDKNGRNSIVFLSLPTPQPPPHNSFLFGNPCAGFLNIIHPV